MPTNHGTSGALRTALVSLVTKPQPQPPLRPVRPARVRPRRSAAWRPSAPPPPPQRHPLPALPPPPRQKNPKHPQKSMSTSLRGRSALWAEIKGSGTLQAKAGKRGRPRGSLECCIWVRRSRMSGPKGRLLGMRGLSRTAPWMLLLLLRWPVDRRRRERIVVGAVRPPWGAVTRWTSYARRCGGSERERQSHPPGQARCKRLPWGMWMEVTWRRCAQSVVRERWLRAGECVAR